MMLFNPYYFSLEILRKVYLRVFGKSHRQLMVCESDLEKVSEIIFNMLNSDKPCMIARFGVNEISCINNYLSITDQSHNICQYIKGDISEWWRWNAGMIKNMYDTAGFFPPTDAALRKFSELMLYDAKEIDVLAVIESTVSMISNITSYLPADLIFTKLSCIDPYRSQRPWSEALRGKDILVVHPFYEDINSQYFNNRERIFQDQRVLPEFKSIRVVKAIQSHEGSDQYDNWFEALEWMKTEMDKEPYDIALIGCGAYGFPLAAYSKRTGHKAVHMGGGLQLLFGIKGKRWDNPKFGVSQLYNDSWIYPSESTRPKNIDRVEGGCYW